MARVLITGGAGFIGSHVVDELLANRNEIVIYDNFSSGKIGNIKHNLQKITLISNDIRNIEALELAMANVDFVIHLAALVSVQESIMNPELSYDINVLGTRNVFSAALKNKVKKVIYASSAAVFGENPEVPKNEDSILTPISPYGENKLQNEIDSKDFNLKGLNTIGLRFFNVFGERQDSTSPYSGVLSIFLSNVQKSKDLIIYGDGKQTRDFVYVKNISNLISYILEKDIENSIYNVGTGVETSLNNVVERLDELSCKKNQVIYKNFRTGDIIRSFCDISKIKSELGYTVKYDFVDGIRKVWDSLNQIKI